MTAVERRDVHQSITDTIVAAIEAGAGDFHMPWHRPAGSTMRPRNVETGARYQGINVLTLWISAESHGYASPVWGTFKQWLEKGYPVRKGERASFGVIYKEIARQQPSPETGEQMDRRIALARAFALFNADQVDGYAASPEATPLATPFEAVARAEQLFATSSAKITETGDSAFYRPATDEIVVPPRTAFRDTPTRPAKESFYGVALHELTHWSGARHRLDRDLSGRFGDAAYAMEELIAELGSAYLCSDLGVSPAARADHAQYLTTWLRVLKADRRAIFTAASQAQRAAHYLTGFLDPGEAPTPSRPPARILPAGPEPDELKP